MQSFVDFTFRTHAILDRVGSWLPQLALRAVVGWEFLESGVARLGGENWFASIRDDFPFPLSAVAAEAGWFMATWAEVLGGLGIWLGMATRFWSTLFVILTVVAIAAVHWPAEWHTLAGLLQGYALTDRGFGNYELPLILLAMLLPLIFGGAGKASVDHLVRLHFARR
jgi:putative oxidoreductase